MKPSFFRLFLEFLLPRLLLSLLFGYLGYTGSGGDPDVYRLLGGYLRDLFMDPANASLLARMEQQNFGLVQEGYLRLFDMAQQLYDGSLESLLGETGITIIIVHAALYALWDDTLIVVLVQSVLSALAHAAFVRGNGLYEARRWLQWNPISLFFCATHYKESFTETCVLLLMMRARSVPSWAFKLLAAAFLFFLRLDYLAFMAVIFVVFRFKPLREVPYTKVVLGMLALFLVMPSMYADWMISSEGAGGVFSIVYANEVTRRVLGPIVGIIQPLPFLIPVSDWWTFFYALFGLCYYYIWIRIVRMDAGSARIRGNAYITAALIVGLIISYRFTGQSGTKDRYFAPFFPLLIAGYCIKRREHELFEVPAALPVPQKG